jgi:hypothetical protein
MPSAAPCLTRKVCNMDRICLSVAILPMSREFGWPASLQVRRSHAGPLFSWRPQAVTPKQQAGWKQLPVFWCQARTCWRQGVFRQVPWCVHGRASRVLSSPHPELWPPTRCSPPALPPQGVIQSAFLWGYMATQLLGGALADK